MSAEILRRVVMDRRCTDSLRFFGSDLLLLIGCHLRRRVAHLNLGAHFLQASSKLFNLFLQLLHFAVLFEKLIEQHRIYLIVTNAVRLSFFVAHYEIGIYLFHILGHKSQLACACRINLLSVRKITGLSENNPSLACCIG